MTSRFRFEVVSPKPLKTSLDLNRIDQNTKHESTQVLIKIDQPIQSYELCNVNSGVPKVTKKGKIKAPKLPKAPKIDKFLPFASSMKQGSVELLLPIKTVSEGNNFQKWQEKAKRHKIQKSYVSLYMRPAKQFITLPCQVLVKRYGPRLLDRQDNLPYSQKWIVDQIAAELTGETRAGKADSNDRISWAYDQEKSEAYGVGITIVSENLNNVQANGP